APIGEARKIGGGGSFLHHRQVCGMIPANRAVRLMIDPHRRLERAERTESRLSFLLRAKRRAERERRLAVEAEMNNARMRAARYVQQQKMLARSQFQLRVPLWSVSAEGGKRLAVQCNSRQSLAERRAEHDARRLLEYKHRSAVPRRLQQARATRAAREQGTPHLQCDRPLQRLHAG